MVLANFAEASFNRLLLIVIAKWVTAIAENGRRVVIKQNTIVFYHLFEHIEESCSPGISCILLEPVKEHGVI